MHNNVETSVSCRGHGGAMKPSAHADCRL